MDIDLVAPKTLIALPFSILTSDSHVPVDHQTIFLRDLQYFPFLQVVHL